ncbi:MAG: uncharacterized protein QG656_1119 [Candidatus Hydrogenedentes bacterium]|nr:uncharacterized protein [Candidatus Hydrogenedentota bacterium]
MNVQIAIDTEQIGAFCRRWKVKELCLFGSVLRDDFGSGSDVDVLVDLIAGHGLTLYDWIDMIEELETLLGRRVDLVAKSAIRNPLRRREILRTAEVLYAA